MVEEIVAYDSIQKPMHIFEISKFCSPLVQSDRMYYFKNY